MSFEANDAEVKMVIGDNGGGFSSGAEPSGAPTRRFGLFGDGKRPSLVSGRPGVESSPVQSRAPFVMARL